MAGKEGDDKKKGKSKVMIFGLAGLVLIVGVAFVVCFVIIPPSTSGEDLPETEVETADVSRPESWDTGTLKIDGILVNLAGTNGRRYLKMSLAIEYKSPDPPAVDLVAQEKMVALRDSLITLLSGKTMESLDGMDSKNLLKLEIIEALQPILFEEEKGRIEWVFYDDFLTQ